MTVRCCPNASLKLHLSIVLSICNEFCGPNCHMYGLTMNNTCAICEDAVQTRDTCLEDETQLASTSIATPDTPTNTNPCKGVTCHFCGQNISFEGIPDGAHVYLTPECKPFTLQAEWGTINLHVPPGTVIKKSLTIHMQNRDYLHLTGTPLTIIGDFMIDVATEESFLVLNTDTEHCHIIVENGAVDIGPNTQVKRGNCAVSQFRKTPPTYRAVTDLTMRGSVWFTGCERHCYAAAVSNVVGTVSIHESTITPNTVLVMETGIANALVVTPPTKMMSVSDLLGVFGSDYEIEYACEEVTEHNKEDCSDTIIDHSYEAVNRRLLPAALALIVIFLTNPSFGTRDD